MKLSIDDIRNIAISHKVKEKQLRRELEKAARTNHPSSGFSSIALKQAAEIQEQLKDEYLFASGILLTQWQDSESGFYNPILDLLLERSINKINSFSELL